MKCAWQAYINLLPHWLRQDVDRLGKDYLRELRLRLDRPPELVLNGSSVFIEKVIDTSDLDFVINAASQYSPWTAITATQGYITAPGGHRVGICGEIALGEQELRSVRYVSSVSIRVARDFIGISSRLTGVRGSILIIGAPGTGKTTLLRDLIRQSSDNGNSSVAVVDERQEIFPIVRNRFCFYPGMRTDVLTGCPKKKGISNVLRTMTPGIIAVDEITDAKDCHALLSAGWCGVTLIATAHAKNRRELESRQIYKPLLNSGLFQTLIVLHEDLSWEWERMDE